MEEFKRMFFALEIAAPWPSKLPEGRLIDEPLRHLTLAFLGKTDFHKISSLLPTLPLPSFKVGFAGVFDECLFLPKRHPRVVAWHVDWLDDTASLMHYHETLIQWLKQHELLQDDRPDLLPHVTLSRAPFLPHSWEKAFTPLPLMAHGIHLYESHPHSKYQSRWHHALKPPFDEIEHTADIAFHIYGETLSQIYRHAQIALAFKFPALLPFLRRSDNEQNLEEIVMKLNEAIAHADGEIGCPFKAVSFHGELQHQQEQVLMWEMVVDV
jgi:RNA 2',3'-cyclic 3'-phosphodiesterase